MDLVTQHESFWVTCSLCSRIMRRSNMCGTYTYCWTISNLDGFGGHIYWDWNLLPETCWLEATSNNARIAPNGGQTRYFCDFFSIGFWCLCHIANSNVYFQLFWVLFNQRSLVSFFNCCIWKGMFDYLQNFTYLTGCLLAILFANTVHFSGSQTNKCDFVASTELFSCWISTVFFFFYKFQKLSDN